MRPTRDLLGTTKPYGGAQTTLHPATTTTVRGVEVRYQHSPSDRERGDVDAWATAHASDDIDEIVILKSVVLLNGRNLHGDDTSDIAERTGNLTADLNQALARLHRP